MLSLAIIQASSKDPAYKTAQDRLEESREKPSDKSTADHSKFEILQQEFTSPEQVTAACLSCHTYAADQIQETIHWTWVCPKSKDQTLGKATVINNFCMAMPSNEPRCTSCHTGYGWKDKNFDFTSDVNVDCLVCHDQTGTYEKFPVGAGYPVKEKKFFKPQKKWYYPPDYNKIAANIGRPRRENCGTCHYFGGGGNKVKHGDLDLALNTADKQLDVHMDMNGLDFDCVTCHTTKNHKIAGRCYKSPAVKEKNLGQAVHPDEIKRIYCESCHTAEPHDIAKLNHHTDKVACQTCHVPVMAKANPTKMWWDWSKAGRLNEKGKPIVEWGKLDDGTKVQAYNGKKGEFRWARNAVPEYYWYDGTMTSTVVSDKIDPTGVVNINHIHGSYDDPEAKIYPFKVHRGIQPYDSKYNTFVISKLFGKKGTGAYWKHFNWDMAISAGMEYVGAPYSGEYEFVETQMWWIIAHMVSPKEDALDCEVCHTPTGSRLDNLAGFYMPGRDTGSWIDWFGLIGIGVVFLGVVGHGFLRIFFFKKRSKSECEEEEDNG